MLNLWALAVVYMQVDWGQVNEAYKLVTDLKNNN